MARRRKKSTLPFNKKLVLNQYILSMFGGVGFKGLADRINFPENEGVNEGNISRFCDPLANLLGANAALDIDTLLAYDANIIAHTKAIQGKRPEPVRWKYFQYLALLFTEIYLDRYFNRRQELLDGLNAFLVKFNAKMGENLPLFGEDDLRRIAFWSATGSGKTLIMHVNIKQVEHYLSKAGRRREINRILLITPNEGLSHQHLEEMEQSGIRAEIFSKSGSAMFRGTTVEIIEIQKLAKKDGDKTVAVDSFEHNNFVLIDEGHRGSSGDVWGKYRRSLAREGFAIEYSATLGQAAAASDELKERYAKSILFDYSYQRFYNDGYGKDYRIFNLPEANDDAIREMYLTASMLAFYQQKCLFNDEASKAEKFNIENPLCVFVGSSVNAVKTQNGKKVSDVIDLLLFLARLVNLDNKPSVIERINLIKNGKASLTDAEGNNVFSNMFSHIVGMSAEAIYDDLLKRVFNTNAGGALHMEELKGADGEIALRLGNNEKFGVINVGDTRTLCRLCNEHDELEVSDENFTGSLFHRINDPASRLNILIGSKRFTEGWNSWRVSTMGLMNVGRSEGSQVIQLFGRGVRLRGLNGGLKRHSALNLADTDVADKDKLAMLETLNIFGVRADYMEQFKKYLEDEGVPTEETFERIILPVTNTLGDARLKTIKLKGGVKFTRDGGKISLQLNTNQRMNSITLDYYPKVQSTASEGVAIAASFVDKNSAKLSAGHLAMLDLDALFSDLQRLKKQRGWFHLCISKEAIKSILENGDWYELYIPKDRLALTDMRQVDFWQGIASSLMQKYCDRFYKYEESDWEKDHREYAILKRDDSNFISEYEITVDKKHKKIIDELNTIRCKIKKKEFSGVGNFGNAEVITFNKHLYIPLIYAAGEDVRINPQPLNKGEKAFVDAVKIYYANYKDTFASKELYLLRNMSRGHGVGFFEAGNFYPDFIMWLVDGDKQIITFIDPKGLMMLDLNDPKIKFYKEIEKVEKQMGDEDVKLFSFIVSTSQYDRVKNNLGGMSKDKLKEKHILFQEDSDHVNQLFDTLLQP